MRELSPVDRQALISAIASREGTAREIAKWYDTTPDELRAFVEDNRPAIEMAKTAIDIAESEIVSKLSDVTPKDLADLWISNKTSRLQRYEAICDYLYVLIMEKKAFGTDLSTALREFRSYAIAAANELGQLLHRGAGDSGDGDTMSVDIVGVDPERLR